MVLKHKTDVALIGIQMNAAARVEPGFVAQADKSKTEPFELTAAWLKRES